LFIEEYEGSSRRRCKEGGMEWRISKRGGWKKNRGCMGETEEELEKEANEKER